MTNIVIERTKLQQLIAQAIQEAHVLSYAEAEALTRVARSSTRVLRGNWYSYSASCGCPAYQAGLATSDDDCSSAVKAFTGRFDSLTRPLSMQHNNIIEVVE